MSASSPTNVQQRVASGRPPAWTVLRAQQPAGPAFVETPDGVRIESGRQDAVDPVRNEQSIYPLTEAEIPKAQAWYAEDLRWEAGHPQRRAGSQNLPEYSSGSPRPTRSRRRLEGCARPHRFRREDHAAFVKKIEAPGIKLERTGSQSAAGTRSPTSPIPGVPARDRPTAPLGRR